MTDLEIIKYFHNAHFQLWAEIFTKVSKLDVQNVQDFNIDTIREEAFTKLFPGFNDSALYNNCFGCLSSDIPYFIECDDCFLKLKCLDTGSSFHYLSTCKIIDNSNKEEILIHILNIQNCGHKPFKNITKESINNLRNYYMKIICDCKLRIK